MAAKAMVSLRKQKRVTPIPETPFNTSDESHDQFCSSPCCFFCTMKEPDARLRRAGIGNFLRGMALSNNQQHVLALSSLWHVAMSQPNDPEFPSLGIFDCMATLIQKGIKDRNWLLNNQNIYVPYYAAHIIGSYTMGKEDFAQIAVQSGVIPSLMELLRGKLSWIEQRVAVRALGHLASYESTFGAVAKYEEEVVKMAMNLASTCLEVVYADFVGLNDVNKRLKYHRNLLTRGIGGLEMENRRAEEWASQLQCWSLYILNCFACKERSLNLICKIDFLEDLCDMWGGLVNHTSPAGFGLTRILCYSKVGRKRISDLPKVIKALGNLSRSSDDWQYVGIDCLLLLLKDPDTRYKVIDIAAFFLNDLIELTNLGDKSNLGEAITKVLLLEYENGKFKSNKHKVEKPLQEILELKVQRRNREKLMSEEKLQERRVLMSLIKQEANHMFWLGAVEEALIKYSEALDKCPLKFRKERMVLYSNRSQCYILLKDPDSAITDSTRALCLSNPANSHLKSLWRRSQAYDMKGMAKESLTDCIMFINGCIKSDNSKRVMIPYHAARMISKQMNATWLFATAHSKLTGKNLTDEKLEESNEGKNEQKPGHDHMMMESKGDVMHGLSTIIEEPFLTRETDYRRKMERARRRQKKGVVARSA
ncbi:hypothetical protein L6164_015490 [Bauhinia variegata]|uniref:Uncharacterized protein n=1 Tax=Bauhinia variegata TaxID=167791 RepID=A0ACB9NMH2_BAUVA|nr:hypothetical protein L6164_015490 [Bauhinia variegata]